MEELPLREVGHGEVRVCIRAIGVNPVDTYIRSGSNPQQTLPYTPGIDAAGVVEAIGTGVNRVKVGDRVYIGGTLTGTYAEYALCQAAQVFPLPGCLTFAQGAAINVPYGTAYRALYQRGQAVPGEIAFIHGATGGVGVAAVQLGRSGGLTVIATGGTERGRELAAQQGAHHVLNHHEPDYLSKVMPLTEGHGVDVIVEMLANLNLAKDIPLLAQRGRLVVVGSRGNIEINPRELMKRDADIRAMILFNASPREMVGIHAALAPGLANGTLRPVIGKEIPLAEADRAHRAVLEAGAYGKIVLVP